MPARTLLRATFYLRLARALYPIGLRAQLLVDCSGTNPNQYPSINAALQQAAAVGTTILVTGTCSETVNLQGMVGLNLGAPYGIRKPVLGRG